MAAGEFVPKQQLIERIKRIAKQREDGFLTILTNTQRSVLLRFSGGRLIQSRCRSKDIMDAIQVLLESTTLKFNYAAAPAEDLPEIIPIGTFLQAIGQSINAWSETPVAPDASPKLAPKPIPAQTPDGIDPDLLRILSNIAREYIGMVADIVVQDILSQQLTISETIDQIANSIPDAKMSKSFRTQARNALPNF